MTDQSANCGHNPPASLSQLGSTLSAAAERRCKQHTAAVEAPRSVREPGRGARRRASAAGQASSSSAEPRSRGLPRAPHRAARDRLLERAVEHVVPRLDLGDCCHRGLEAHPLLERRDLVRELGLQVDVRCQVKRHQVKYAEAAHVTDEDGRTPRNPTASTARDGRRRAAGRPARWQARGAPYLPRYSPMWRRPPPVCWRRSASGHSPRG